MDFDGGRFVLDVAARRARVIADLTLLVMLVSRTMQSDDWRDTVPVGDTVLRRFHGSTVSRVRG